MLASETANEMSFTETLSLGAACDHSNGSFKKTCERPCSTASAWLVLFWASQNKLYTSTAGLDRITWILCLLDESIILVTFATTFLKTGENALGRAVWSVFDDSAQLMLLGVDYTAGLPVALRERRELSWAEGYAFCQVFGLADAVRAACLIMPEDFNAQQLKNLLANKTKRLLKLVGKTNLYKFKPESLAAFLRQSILTPPPPGGIEKRTCKCKTI